METQAHKDGALLTDADILSRLTNVEDATVERKTASDYRDWVRGAVAFSNSLPLNEPGIIYIGVYNDGRIEGKPITEDFLKKVSRELGNVYPAIYPQIHVKQKDGKDFVVVIVFGSPDKPHFAGKSYIRDGTQSPEASEQQFKELIAKRNSKVTHILEWKEKQITVETLNIEETARRTSNRVARTETKIIRECNQFYATLGDEHFNVESVPLRRVELSFDHPNKRLKFEIYPW